MSDAVGAQAPVGEMWSPDRIVSDDGTVKQVGQWGMVWRRFRRHRPAMISLAVLIVITLLAVFGPLFAPPIHVLTAAQFNTTIPKATPPNLWPLGLNTIMGKDIEGTPITTYLLQGAWPTLLVGFVGALIAALLGALLGGVSGYFGGAVDSVLSRLLDAFFCVPFLPLLMVLAIDLPSRSIIYYCLLLGLTGWPGVARLVRSSVLTLREREYAEAARALGGSDLHVIGRHMLPNAFDILIITMTLNVAVFILALANLTYVSAGPEQMLWATALTQSGNILSITWWLIVFPGAALLITVLAVNFLGDGLRDAFDITSNAAIKYAMAREPGPFGRAVRQTALRIFSAAPIPNRMRRRNRLGTGISPGARPLQLRDVEIERLVPIPSGRLGMAFRVLLPIVALVVGMIVLLATHSPLAYAPHFSVPQTVGTAQAAQEYGATASSTGWRLLFADRSGRMTYEQVGLDGSVVVNHPFGARNNPTFGFFNSVVTPAIANSTRNPSNALGVWVSAPKLVGVWVRGTHIHPFTLATTATTFANPTITPLPNGGYDVVVEQDQNGGFTDLYLIRVSPNGTAGRPTMLVRASPLAYFPRAAIDGSGRLDVTYMTRMQPGLWQWTFRRFTIDGKPAGRPQALGTAQFYGHYPGGTPNPNVLPSQWGIDMQPDGRGGVWAGWTSDAGAQVARWDARGHQVVAPTLVLPTQYGGEAADDHTSNRALAIAPEPWGGIVYHRAAGAYTTYLAAMRFNRSGVPLDLAPQRVSFEAAGTAENPHAVIVGGHSLVIWQRATYANAPIETSSFHVQAAAPDTFTRLGLNIGNPVLNVAFVVVGALALGVGAAAANFGSVLLLLVVWFALRRLRRHLPTGRGPVAYLLGPTMLYVVAILVMLVWLFGVSDSPPTWAPLISGLGSPGRWVAVTGGVVLAWWTGHTLFRRTDPAFRAAAMAFAAVYFVGVMWAVTFIQTQITQV